MIARLLGYTQVQTTAHYAHLAADPVKAAAEERPIYYAFLGQLSLSKVHHFHGPKEPIESILALAGLG